MESDGEKEVTLLREGLPISGNEVMGEKEDLKEITIRGMLITMVLGTIVSSANTYLGLYVGLSISVSIPAAIISVALLKSFGTTVHEINAIQTGSSAGSCVSTGMIFSIPALIIIGYWDSVDWLQTFIVLLFGGALGMLFAIPIRRALIVESPLRFPEGVATAEVIHTILPPKLEHGSEEHQKNATETRKGLLLLLLGALCGAILKICSSSLFLWSSVAYWAFWINSAAFYGGITLSPAVMAIGYIIGFHPCLMMLIGSIFCWWIAIPLTMAYDEISYEESEDAATAAFNVWEDYTRYIGIGAMLLGGIGTIFLLAKPMFHGIKSGVQAFWELRKGGMKQVAREDQDIPIPIIAVVVVFFTVPLFCLCWYFIGIWYVGAFASLMMLFFGFLFACVGAYLAGLVGSSQSPISGVTLATVITAALLLLIFLGFDNPVGPPSAILVGAVICCATSMGSDSMQDLKTGHIVGSTPYKLQIMQIFGILLPSVLLPVVLDLVLKAYGIGEPTEQHPEPLIAPQANLVADISHAIFFGGAPIWMIVIGAGLATLVVVVDAVLGLMKSSFRLYILPIALGLYLPFGNNASVFLGSVVGSASMYVLKRVYPDDKESQETLFRYGVLLSAGIITGEAIAGIVFAIPVVISGNTYILSVVGGAAKVFWPGLIFLFLVMLLLFFSAVHPTLPMLRKFIK